MSTATATAPKTYTLAEVEALTPFSPCVTWANLAALAKEAKAVSVHFKAYDSHNQPNGRDGIGRGITIAKEAVIDRAEFGVRQHGDREFVMVYAFSGTLVFGL
ncbi:hypothetical protein MASR2M8_14210 [Opitutaceae bacterium]